MKMLNSSLFVFVMRKKEFIGDGRLLRSLFMMGSMVLWKINMMGVFIVVRKVI